MTLENLIRANYAETMKFFMTQANTAIVRSYIAAVKKEKNGTSQNWRGKKRGKYEFEALFPANSTLFIMDGETATGKTTAAKAICQKYPDIVLYDIDERLNAIGPTQDAEAILLERLENEILAETEQAQKSIILVGSFRSTINRTIISNTLGRHFKNRIMIIIHDNLADDLKRAYTRNKERLEKEGISQPQYLLMANTMVDKQLREEYKALEELPQKESAIGYDKSIWLDFKAISSI